VRSRTFSSLSITDTGLVRTERILLAIEPSHVGRNWDVSRGNYGGAMALLHW
jgi:hypothetical protein